MHFQVFLFFLTFEISNCFVYSFYNHSVISLDLGQKEKRDYFSWKPERLAFCKLDYPPKKKKRKFSKNKIKIFTKKN